MASSPYDLAQMAVHDEAAARVFPGPDFREVLGWIHAVARPATYVEIGVHSWGSMAVVRPGTLAIGIDPEPRGPFPGPADIRVFPLSSNEFFARHDLRQILGGKAVDFAFIDGLHLFEQALEDLFHLEGYMAPNGIVAAHDTIPLDRETSTRVRRTEFHTGDVWKIVPFLCGSRPELEIITVAAAPAGLTLIRGLDPRFDHSPLLACAAPLRTLEYDYFERHRGEFLRLIPNRRADVEGFCQNTPVQSMRSSGAVTPSL